MSAFAGFDTTLRGMFVERPKAYFLSLRTKLKDLPRTNFDLGCDFAERGQWKDAAFRFKVAIHLQPNFAQAHYNLGCCQLRLGERSNARKSLLTTLKLVPDHTDALFMLSAVDANAVPAERRPQRMPSGMVLQFFSGIAAAYDAMEVQNNYQGGRAVYDALKPMVAKQQDLVIVDMGAGTGIASRPWRPIAKEIVAVDFSPLMAAEARQIKIAEAPLFDRVLEEDLFDPASSAAPLAEADLVLFINTAQFIGNLQPFLAAVAAKLKPGALLAMTIEPFSAPSGYGVNIETGRFGHHPEYLKLTATQAGLQVKKEQRVQLYAQFNAQLFVLGK